MRFTLRDAQECAKNYIREGRACSGCRFGFICGIDDRDRDGLVHFLDKVDPSKQNLIVAALGPVITGEVQA